MTNFQSILLQKQRSIFRMHLPFSVIFAGAAGLHHRKLDAAETTLHRYLHFGDIDAGGFYIFEQLRQKTGIPFEMYRMSVDILRDGRFRRCLQSLTEDDRVRLKSLAEKDMFREVAGYMLEEMQSWSRRL